MNTDTYSVRWYSEYGQYDLDPSTKVGQGLCSCTGCDKPCAFVVERTVDQGDTWDGAEFVPVVRHWGLCYDHAQTQITGYWTPGMAQVMTPDDQPASRPGR